MGTIWQWSILKNLVCIFCVSHVSSEREKTIFLTRQTIFPVGPVSCQRTDGFFNFCFNQLPYHLSSGVRGDCTSQTDVSVMAWSCLCSTSHVFEMPNTPELFPSVLQVGCNFPLSMRMSSWYRSSWISLQSGPVPLSQAVVSTCWSTKECSKLCLG